MEWPAKQVNRLPIVRAAFNRPAWRPNHASVLHIPQSESVPPKHFRLIGKQWHPRTLFDKIIYSDTPRLLDRSSKRSSIIQWSFRINKPCFSTSLFNIPQSPFKRLQHTDQGLQNIMYNIRLVLDYNSVIWLPFQICYMNAIEAGQRAFNKRLPSRKTFSTTNASLETIITNPWTLMTRPRPICACRCINNGDSAGSSIQRFSLNPNRQYHLVIPKTRIVSMQK